MALELVERTRNLDKKPVEHCRYCDDLGWVVLHGRVLVSGVSYTRGTTACKWCMRGTQAYLASKAQGVELGSDYTEADIEIMDRGAPATRQQARLYSTLAKSELAKLQRHTQGPPPKAAS